MSHGRAISYTFIQAFRISCIMTAALDIWYQIYAWSETASGVQWVEHGKQEQQLVVWSVELLLLRMIGV